MLSSTNRTATLLTSLVLVSGSALGQPSTIELDGTVRDFKKSHADFDVTPADGMGHYAANVGLTLGVDDRPVFSGGGFKVSNQWTNSGSQPIAPHLYSTGGNGGVVKLANGPQIDNNPTLDTWDSSKGSYGLPDNVGPAPTFETGAEMPVVNVPTSLPPKISDWKATGNGTTLLAYDVHCDKFEILNNHTVRVSGNVTIVADELFKVNNHAVIELLPGATLEIYALKDCDITNYADVNVNTEKPYLVTIYYFGISELKLSNNTDIYAHIIAPTGGLLIENNANFYGVYTGQDFHIKNSGDFHADTNSGGGTSVCGSPINDNMGAASVTSNGDVTSSATFDEWYSNVLTANVSMPHAITLVRDGMGIYTYTDNSFYPIDGVLYGNEYDAHNYNFTYAIEANFEYEGCQGQFIELSGADDIWLFVDGNLVIDLGGIEPGTEQVIEMDRLGLTDTGVYTVHLFYANRHGGGSRLHVRTNLELWTDGEVINVASYFD